MSEVKGEIKMEAVKAFNQELSSLYELKPPISKARMTNITKTAIKGWIHQSSLSDVMQGCQMEKFDPFLTLDIAPMPSTLAQSKERKGSNFAA